MMALAVNFSPAWRLTAQAGYIIWGARVPPEPSNKRAIAFFDGQNLFYAAKVAFNIPYPNFDPIKLATEICKGEGWTLVGTHFYTGVPQKKHNLRWHTFWTNKLQRMKRDGAETFPRSLAYRNYTSSCNRCGGNQTEFIPYEKDVDINIALDIILCAFDNQCNVILIFSQDQDLSKVVGVIHCISKAKNRWIKVASAYPKGAGSHNFRGIDKTDFITFDRETYNSCIDPRDYR